MNLLDQEVLPAKIELGTRMFLLLEFQAVLLIFLAISSNLIVFWFLTLLFIVGLEFYAWNTLKKVELSESSRTLWRKVQETPLLPFKFIILSVMVFLDLFRSRVSNYRELQLTSGNDQTDESESEMEIKQQKRIFPWEIVRLIIGFILFIFFLIFIPILYFRFFEFIIVNLLAYGISKGSSRILGFICFIFLELTMFGLYKLYNRWVRQPLEAEETDEVLED